MAAPISVHLLDQEDNPVFPLQDGGKVGIDPDLNVVVVGGTGKESFARFTPANTSHAAGDVVGGLQEFRALGLPKQVVSIRTVRLKARDSSAEVTGWLLKVYNRQPTTVQVDDAAWDFTDADFAAYKGDISIGSTGTDQGANQFAMATNGCMEVQLSETGSLWTYLVNDTTLTLPATERLVEMLVVGL